MTDRIGAFQQGATALRITRYLAIERQEELIAASRGKASDADYPYRHKDLYHRCWIKLLRQDLRHPLMTLLWTIDTLTSSGNGISVRAQMFLLRWQDALV